MKTKILLYRGRFDSDDFWPMGIFDTKEAAMNFVKEKYPNSDWDKYNATPLWTDTETRIWFKTMKIEDYTRE